MGPEAGAAPRLAEMKERVEKDPKSRLFVQLADEYRKAGQPGEAIAALRRGLEHHPSYVAAWNVLAKLYIESGRDLDAQPALEKSLSLDPQNVVAARLLGDVHYRRGSLVEAIKKYKLVRAIAPGDSVLEELIDQIEAQVGPGQRPEALPATVAGADPQKTQAMVPSREAPEAIVPAAEPLPDPVVEPPAAVTAAESLVAPSEDESSPFDDSQSSHRAAVPEATGGFDSDDLWHEATDAARASEPAASLSEPAPEPAAAGPEPDGEEFRTAYIPNAAFLAQMGRPGGAEEPSAAPRQEPIAVDEEPPAIPFGAPEEEGGDASSDEPIEAAGEAAGEPASTLTMADLYLQQGHLVSARGILESLLRRDPTNPEARERLEEVARLEDEGAAASGVPSAPPGGIPGTIALLSKWLEAVRQG